jgi:choline dehydrogenase-like flavoprotein
MFTIRFITDAFAPNETMVLRAAGPTAWLVDLGGDYDEGAWRFELDEADYPTGIEFKFVLKPGRWMFGANLVIAPTEIANPPDYTEAQVTFPPVSELVTERGVIAQRLVAPNFDPSHVYDVIVVGSGAGGGTLASRLADAGRDVLVLEAGPYLFPTHVANLPRRLRIGQFDKHVWGLWPDFKVVNYVNVEGSEFAGGQGFNLGGRSIFWGGLIPRLSEWELATWPTPVREYLLANGYGDAENEVNRTVFQDSPYQNQSRQFLQQTLGPGFLVSDAPVAVQYRGFTNLSLAGGMWSSADLLLEDRLLDASKAAPDWKRNSPTINLNHAVWNVTLDPAGGRRVTGVRCRDLLAGETRTYQAKNVVLSAGTLESAKIALNSGLSDSVLLGKGVTDHEIRYVHFTLPPGSPHTSSTSDPNFQSARLIAEPAAADPEHPFLIGLELGAEFNQGRYIDLADLTEEVRTHQDWLLCELVFQFNSALVTGNSVQTSGRPVEQGGAADPLTVNVQRSEPSNAAIANMNQIATNVLGQLDAQPVITENTGLALLPAALGGVAHEVGTLRMATDNQPGVVNTDLAFPAYDNLYACDNSIFPTSPASNPTLTLIALALRLAAHIDATLP